MTQSRCRAILRIASNCARNSFCVESGHGPRPSDSPCEYGLTDMRIEQAADRFFIVAFKQVPADAAFTSPQPRAAPCRRTPRRGNPPAPFPISRPPLPNSLPMVTITRFAMTTAPFPPVLHRSVSALSLPVLLLYSFPSVMFSNTSGTPCGQIYRPRPPGSSAARSGGENKKAAVKPPLLWGRRQTASRVSRGGRGAKCTRSRRGRRGV